MIRMYKARFRRRIGTTVHHHDVELIVTASEPDPEVKASDAAVHVVNARFADVDLRFDHSECTLTPIEEGVYFL